jgi:hypothetical protein
MIASNSVLFFNPGILSKSYFTAPPSDLYLDIPQRLAHTAHDIAIVPGHPSRRQCQHDEGRNVVPMRGNACDQSMIALSILKLYISAQGQGVKRENSEPTLVKVALSQDGRISPASWPARKVYMLCPRSNRSTDIESALTFNSGRFDHVVDSQIRDLFHMILPGQRKRISDQISNILPRHHMKNVLLSRLCSIY